jgi:DNA-binding Lrp family transcriptional regulator
VEQYDLDDVDRGILHDLQENARDATIEAMGESVGVSASTVRNRIDDMEAAGIIDGYSPHVDYARAGFDLHFRHRCRADVDHREAVAKSALDVDGVVAVQELLDSRQNVIVEAVATDPEHMTLIHDSIMQSGLEIRETEYVRNAYRQPFDHFGSDVTDD